jgi:hypothetical protein
MQLKKLHSYIITTASGGLKFDFIMTKTDLWQQKYSVFRGWISTSPKYVTVERPLYFVQGSSDQYGFI